MNNNNLTELYHQIKETWIKVAYLCKESDFINATSKIKDIFYLSKK